MIALPGIMSSVSYTEATALQTLAKGRTVLEVGSWRGFSTVAMAQVATVVHSVDWHLGDEHAGHDESLSHLIDNIDKYNVRDRVVVHVGDAATVLPMLKPDSFDFAFIDAFHTVEAVRRDIDLVEPLLITSDRCLAFHDYGDARFGVTEAVDERGWRIDVIDSLAIVRW